MLVIARPVQIWDQEYSYPGNFPRFSQANRCPVRGHKPPRRSPRRKTHDKSATASNLAYSMIIGNRLI